MWSLEPEKTSSYCFDKVTQLNRDKLYVYVFVYLGVFKSTCASAFMYMCVRTRVHMCIRWYSGAWSDRKTETYALKESMKEKEKKIVRVCHAKVNWFDSGWEEMRLRKKGEEKAKNINFIKRLSRK